MPGKLLGAVALSLILQPFAGQMAFADDDCTIRVVPAPGFTESYVMPESNVYKVITAPVVVEPTTTTRFVTPFEEPMYTRQETIIEKQTTMPATIGTEASNINTEVSDVGRKPMFHIRLNNIKQQVDKGVSNGWLSSLQASEFQSRADALLKDADAHLVSVADTGLGDSIERQVNQLNIDVTSSMQLKQQIGSDSQMQ